MDKGRLHYASRVFVGNRVLRVDVLCVLSSLAVLSRQTNTASTQLNQNTESRSCYSYFSTRGSSQKGDYPTMQTKSSAGLLGIIAVAAIVLFIVMAAAGPGSRFSNGWNSLTTGNGTTSQIPAAGPSIVGGPSLSASKIDQILTNAGSPAAGTGAQFVLDSAQYNIDDSVALAFFKHESSFGLKGAAVDTHSIGNINCTPGYSCIGRFRSYSSWDAGIDDWYKLMSSSAYVGGGLVTVSQIIPKYAPNSDNNNETAYIAAVQADVQSWRAS